MVAQMKLSQQNDISISRDAGIVRAPGEPTNFLVSGDASTVRNYACDGNDLVIEFDDGKVLRIEGFFTGGAQYNNLVFVDDNAQWLANFDPALGGGDGIADAQVVLERIEDDDSTLILLGLLGAALAGAGGIAAAGGSDEKPQAETDTTSPSRPDFAAADDADLPARPIEHRSTTNDASPVLTGTAEAGSTVHIYDNGRLIGTAQAGTDGTWAFTPSPPLADGQHLLTATSTDADGNVSPVSELLDITVDTTTGAPLVVVTGNGNGTITVTGTAEPGATLTITYPDGTSGSVVAGPNGNYTITSPGVQSSGTVSAQATDAAGNDGPPATAAYTDAVDPAAPSVTVTGNGDGTITVTGTAEPGATLTVTYPDGTSGSVVAGPNGNYTITSPGVQSSGTVSAQATDAAGNDGPVASAAYTDAVDPAAPSVTVTGNGDGTITVTGTAEPGATLTVTYPDGTFGSVVAGPNGNYAITSPGVQTTGTVTAQATDVAGNDGPSSTAAYTDAVDPAAPSVTVTGNGDGTITVTGTAEPGATLTVTYPDGTFGSVVAGRNGNYAITSPGVQTTGTVTAQATDVAGNDGPSSTAAYTDAVDPAAPSVTVTGNGDGTITVTGTAEPGATLTVTYPDGTFGSVVAGPNGNYAITSPGVQTTGTVTAQATDVAGNDGPSSTAAYTDAVDPAAPSVTVTGNGDGTITVTGTAEPGATLTITYPDGTTGTVVAGPNGNYTITSPGVQTTGTVTAQTTDAAGNNGPSSTAAYTDAVDPAAPSVAVTGNGDGTITVTGTAEPGATLTVTYPDGTTGSVIADVTGQYSITSPGVQTSGTVTAQATDAAGNDGPSSTTAYVDAVDPAAPSVAVTGNGDGTITVTGTAEPGATLTVTYPDGTSGTVVAGHNGNYAITSPGVQTTGTVTAQATDAAGNDGPVASAAYTDAVNPAAPSVTVTGNGDGTITVTGTAEPGATLSITYPDGTTGSVVAGPNGQYSITSPGVQTTGTVTAQATDAAGNDGPSSTAAYTDAVNPAAPSVTVTGNGDGTITVTGTAEPGATLTVTYPDGTTGTVIADVTGQYSITSPGVQTTGTVTAQTTDAAGNNGPSSTAAYTDAVDPAAPSVAVTGNGDGTITVTGTAEPGATLTVTYPDGTSGTVVAGHNGNYTITSPSVQTTGTVTAQATDAAGNDGPSSTAAYVDAVDPAAPSVTVTGNGDGTITVTGTAEPGATLTVTYPDGTTGSVVAGPNGSYTITSPGVQTTGTVTAQATDAAGNNGPSSTAAYVDAVNPAAPSVTVTGNGDGTITVTGTAEPGATLTVTYPDGTTGSVIADVTGQYSITSPGVQTTGTVTAQATDAAGNDGPSSTAAYTDAVNPAAPSVTVTGNGDGTITVTGTAEPGATLTVTYPDGTSGTVVAGHNGNYTITSPSVQTTGTVTAQATDAAGNDGPSSTAAYVDAVDPAAPSVTVTGNGDGTITVTGTAEPGATLTVTYPDGTTGSVVAGPNGSYTITSPGVQTTGTVTAQATDAAGNDGPSSTVVYTDAVDPDATATITAFTDNQSQHIGDFLNGALTNDAEPLLKGDVSSLADGDIVRIYRGAALIGTAAIAGNSWSFQLGALAEGTHSYVAVIADQAGNEGAPSSPFSLTVDTSITPGTLSLTGFTDTGTSASDFLTQDTAFDLSLAGSEAGASIVYQISANAGTSWTATTLAQAGLTDGAYLYRAVVTDAAGNSAVSNSIAVTVDNTAPAAGTITLTGYTDSGTSASDFISTDTTFNLSLSGQEAAAGIAYSRSIDGGASWTATTSAQTGLADGQYQFRAVVTDAAGNVATTNAFTVTVDTAITPGTLSLFSFTDTGTSASDFLTQDTAFDLSLAGSEAGAAVVYQISANAGASWTATTTAQSGLADGAYLYRAVVTDAAGNSAASNSIAVTVDTAVTPGTLSLTGFTDTGTSASDFLTQDTAFDLSLAGSEAGATVVYQISANARCELDGHDLCANGPPRRRLSLPGRRHRCGREFGRVQQHCGHTR
ncbi:Ig-like domain-containing protein [Pararhizobium sp.]|uniref:Ig-like domain-containing protein n=1 Tax=Pararhizobium sp. TaxID=1977563 RepID=UPI003D0EF35B